MVILQLRSEQFLWECFKDIWQIPEKHKYTCYVDSISWKENRQTKSK